MIPLLLGALLFVFALLARFQIDVERNMLEREKEKLAQDQEKLAKEKQMWLQMKDALQNELTSTRNSLDHTKCRLARQESYERSVQHEFAKKQTKLANMDMRLAKAKLDWDAFTFNMTQFIEEIKTCLFTMNHFATLYENVASYTFFGWYKDHAAKKNKHATTFSTRLFANTKISKKSLFSDVHGIPVKRFKRAIRYDVPGIEEVNANLALAAQHIHELSVRDV